MAPFLWAIFLALPAAAGALFCAAMLAPRVPTPFAQHNGATILFRLVLFVVVAGLAFVVFLVGGVELAMWLGL